MRWYNIEVVYEGQPPSYVIMGELPMNASIEQVYKILGNIGIQFRVEGRINNYLNNNTKIKIIM